MDNSDSSGSPPQYFEPLYAETSPCQDIELNVDIDDSDALELHEEKFLENHSRNQPLGKAVAGHQDEFVQSLLQRELERRRELAELAEQERISRAPSRTSAPSRLSSEARGSSAPRYSRPSTSSDVYPVGNADDSYALAMQDMEVVGDGRMSLAGHGRVSLAVNNAENVENGAKGVEARIDALRRRSSFRTVEKPDPIGFVREKGVLDQVNQVEMQLRRVRAKKQVNDEHMYCAMINAGIINVDPGVKLPTRPVSSHGHGRHKSRPRPVKKENVEAANKWMRDSTPNNWLLFSEKECWIQNREIQKELKHMRVQMLRRLNKKGCSFGKWLTDHGREYGAYNTGTIYKYEPDTDLEDKDFKKTDKKSDKKATAVKEETNLSNTRTSMALNEGTGMMYKGVAAVRGPDHNTNTARFWRPNANPLGGLQAPTGFHTM